MLPLQKTYRSQLERTIKEAREVAENGARAALGQLGVAEPTPCTHLSEQERDLRRKLRIHGRQLGDSLNGGPVQIMDRLVEEVAYEHWHRMLFARFLAENNLLMYPDPKAWVAITLEECEDLAASEGAANGWELAALYSARMLPQIFRPDSPVFQLVFPLEYQKRLEKLLTDLPSEVFLASDSLGWVYQFWQAKRKDEINKSEVKAGARELPAVTQLFTEPYMVSFLLDNSLGAWWAAKKLSEADLINAKTEEELRQKASIEGVSLEYLRFVKNENGSFTLACGAYTKWPDNLADLKILDPCCGSGHFLVALLLMLTPMRMELESLSAKNALDLVLKQNLHGLELDSRCVEIAAFALALTAWKFPDAGGYRILPKMHLACSGLSVGSSKEEWKQLGLGRQNLAVALSWLHDTYIDAPLFGSLLDPSKAEYSDYIRWPDLPGILDSALQQNQAPENQSISVVAQGLAKATLILSQKYHLVITNVPYRAKGKLDQKLQTFFGKHYPEAKNDLATVFLQRCLELCSLGGTTSIVLPQNWLFLTSYKKLRERLLQQQTWHLLARLGVGAFETISGEVVQAVLITLSHGPAHQMQAMGPAKMDQILHGLDVSGSRKAQEKATQLKIAEIKSVEQRKQLENPDARVVLEEVQGGLLEKFASSFQGVKTGDDCAKRRFFWELSRDSRWLPLLSTVDNIISYGGRESVLDWKDHGKDMARLQGVGGWGKPGVAVSQMRNLPISVFCGARFDSNVGPISPHNPDHLPAIWCFCSSPQYHEAVREIDQSLKVTNATLVKVPFDLAYWTKIAEEKYPKGLPKPYSDDPTQWIFHGHPCASVIWDETSKWTAFGPPRSDSSVLQIAVARLLGYRWPAELDPDMDLALEQRELVNRCQEMLPFSDEDGIVCIPSVRGEAKASDRLLDLLVKAYGDQWRAETLGRLLSSANHAGKSLESWLRDKFFGQHCQLFLNRPFIWHIWDGLPDGFSALVNYHKLNKKLLETLIYTYLGDWISLQKYEISVKIDGSEEKLAAAENLKKRLESILIGETPYDIFVRWKPLSKQPLGWEPDLNDGVRLNIRPFLSVPSVGKKKGAGILRDKPSIKWDKDRGKDLESAPWYHLFKGDRINDHHLSLAEKKVGRGKGG